MKLTIRVGDTDIVKIDDAQPSDSAANQCLGSKGADTSKSHDDDKALAEPFHGVVTGESSHSVKPTMQPIPGFPRVTVVLLLHPM